MLTSSDKLGGMDNVRPATKVDFDAPPPRASKVWMLVALGALAWGLAMLAGWGLLQLFF
jgi:hypothetical protein